ncbi:MAG: hypothetical protein JSW63_11295 [Ignavibacterium sp.]|nr:MAG: hypothetical protein JSW63_11295 [Ignavibacterium sp.]
MQNLNRKYYITGFIFLYYVFCMFSHSIISSLHLIEHLIEDSHYHLDEFHNPADNKAQNDYTHSHGFLIDTILTKTNENETSSDLDEVLLQLFKINQHIPEYAIDYLSSLFTQGNKIPKNILFESQSYIEPLVPPPQDFFS